MLPWLRVPSNKSQRAQVNAAYGAPLVKIYPRGALYSSPTASANFRVYKPGQNQVGDPRAAGGFYNIDTATAPDLTGLINYNPTTNVGGSVVESAKRSDYSPFLLTGVILLIIWSVFK